MKKILYIFLAGFFLLNSCRDEDLDPRPVIEDNIGAVTLVEVADPAAAFFNLLADDFASQSVDFSVDVDDFDVTEVESVDVQIEFVENDAIFDPFREEFVDSAYAPVVIETLTTFPSNVSVTVQEVADALGIAVADIEVGDNFTATFPINTADGRRLTTALASDLCNQPAQPSFGGCAVQWAASCPSNIVEGEATYDLDVDVATTCCGLPLGDQGDDTATITNLGGGVYRVSDHMGGHVAAFGFDPEPIEIIDVCNTYSLREVGGLNYLSGPTAGVTYDEATGVFTITFDDATNGISGTAVLTPQ